MTQSSKKKYLPKCRICSPLHSPCDLETAIAFVELHKKKFPSHKKVTYYYPIAV